MAVWVRHSLILGDFAGAVKVIDVGLVFGKTFKAIVLEPVSAGIADIEDDDFLAGDIASD
jgi:hypothetical protein